MTTNSQHEKLEKHIVQLSNIHLLNYFSAEVNNLLNDPVQINNDQRKIAYCQNDRDHITELTQQSKLLPDSKNWA